jgi:hypothetical protein
MRSETRIGAFPGWAPASNVVANRPLGLPAARDAPPGAVVWPASGQPRLALQYRVRTSRECERADVGPPIPRAVTSLVGRRPLPSCRCLKWEVRRSRRDPFGKSLRDPQPEVSSSVVKQRRAQGPVRLGAARVGCHALARRLRKGMLTSGMLFRPPLPLVGQRPPEEHGTRRTPTHALGARRERLPTLTTTGAVCARKTCAWPGSVSAAIPASRDRPYSWGRRKFLRLSSRNRQSTCRNARANATHGAVIPRPSRRLQPNSTASAGTLCDTVCDMQI